MLLRFPGLSAAITTRSNGGGGGGGSGGVGEDSENGASSRSSVLSEESVSSMCEATGGERLYSRGCMSVCECATLDVSCDKAATAQERFTLTYSTHGGIVMLFSVAPVSPLVSS